jgi:hypothetical protein
MKAIPRLDTVYVYPAYERKEGNVVYENEHEDYFHIIRLETYIRKKHGNTWYLIPLVIEGKTNCRKFTDNFAAINRIKEDTIHRLMLSAYQIIMFYTIVKLRNMESEKPLLYIDVNQGSEKERVFDGAKGPMIFI